MAIIRESEILKTIDVLDANITFMEWWITGHKKRTSERWKLPKLIERNKEQINYLKTIK